MCKNLILSFVPLFLGVHIELSTPCSNTCIFSAGTPAFIKASAPN
jgi:hypothetical protein